jgi:ankyrin repeat protein
MHHVECLKLMLSHVWQTLERRNAPPSDYPLFNPLILGAIHSSDTFSMILRNGTSYLERLEGTLGLLHRRYRPHFLGGENGYETPIGFAVSEAHDEATKILLKLGWGVEDIDRPNSEHSRTPLLDAVRWNRRHMFKLLLDHGANTCAVAKNPFDQERRNWSALHIFAEQGHNKNLELVSDLLGDGVPVDGLEDSDDESVIVVDTETPFYVAVRKNAFKLADLLLSKGANINALSSRSSLLISDHSLTGLGHIVALNARHCIPSIRYLLNSHAFVISDATPRPGIAAASTASATTDISDTLFNTVAFIVEPTRSLTALHFCAVVPSGLRYVAGNPLSRKDFDFETNSLITHELLDWFLGPEYLNERCALQGRTALHLAAQYSNVGVMKELVGAGADIGARDDDGMTAAEIVRSVQEQNEEVVSKMLRILES